MVRRVSVLWVLVGGYAVNVLQDTQGLRVRRAQRHTRGMVRHVCRVVRVRRVVVRHRVARGRVHAPPDTQDQHVIRVSIIIIGMVRHVHPVTTEVRAVVRHPGRRLACVLARLGIQVTVVCYVRLHIHGMEMHVSHARVMVREVVQRMGLLERVLVVRHIQGHCVTLVL